MRGGGKNCTLPALAMERVPAPVWRSLLLSPSQFYAHRRTLSIYEQVLVSEGSSDKPTEDVIIADSGEVSVLCLPFFFLLADPYLFSVSQLPLPPPEEKAPETEGEKVPPKEDL